MKDKNTAGILALFLGGLGAHRFYLGQVLIGFIYLVFCWTLIPAIISIIDAIIFFSMDDTAFNKKYNGRDFKDPIVELFRKPESSLSNAEAI